MIAGKEAGRCPVKIIDGTAFMFIKHGNMYAVRHRRESVCVARRGARAHCKLTEARRLARHRRPACGCAAPWTQVAVSSGNAQAALAFQFLHDVVKVLTSYFGDFTEGEQWLHAKTAVVARLFLPWLGRAHSRAPGGRAEAWACTAHTLCVSLLDPRFRAQQLCAHLRAARRGVRRLPAENRARARPGVCRMQQRAV